MTRLTDLTLFVRTADLGSLSAAAQALNSSPAAASAALRRLEATWGVPLFVRSTRSLRLSIEGERMLPLVRQALSALTEAQATITRHRSALRGELQLAMPSDLGRNVLLPWLESFQQRHPQLTLRLHLSDRNADLMRVPVDMAIRYGTPPSSTQVALPLAPDNRRLLVASPVYLARHGAPQSASALIQHEALRFMVSDDVPKTWRLGIDGQEVEVPVQGRHSVNDSDVVKRWAIEGLGLAYRSRLDVAADLSSGKLVHVNPHWVGELAPLHLVVPGRRQVTAAARALRDHLVPRLAQLTAVSPPGGQLSSPESLLFS